MFEALLVTDSRQGLVPGGRMWGRVQEQYNRLPPESRGLRTRGVPPTSWCRVRVVEETKEEGGGGRTEDVKPSWLIVIVPAKADGRTIMNLKNQRVRGKT